MSSVGVLFIHRHVHSLGPVAIATELFDRLDEVYSSGVLTAHLEPAFAQVRKHRPMLISGKFLLVLTYSDFSELNILVDGDSGSIIGVIDWTDAAF